MSTSIRSILLTGNSGVLVDVECTITNGLPAIVIVGLGNKSIDEARERIRAAFTSSKLEFPKKRVTINLAPADIPKDSSGFDLAIALAVLCANKQQRADSRHIAYIGELGLGGSVRPVRGIIGKLLAGKKLGITHFIIPKANIEQASLVPNVALRPIARLADCVAGQNSIEDPKFIHTKSNISYNSSFHSGILKEVNGQDQAKRALEIAAAGRHNILLSGPPGTGKSMLAKALPELLPDPSTHEILEITHLHSLASPDFEELFLERPFRAPHHTASRTSIIGGGQRIHPGEVSLSHNGVLLLDEMPEFPRSILEALRQPLEEQKVTITRARETITFPANFILIATANPCPCGYYKTTMRSCECTPSQILRYKQRISGPILDRIDLHVAVHDIDHTSLLTTNSSSKSTYELLRNRISAAYNIQSKRLGGSRTNSSMTNAELQKLALLSNDARAVLDTAAQKLVLSARGYIRTVRVARTIADLNSHTAIEVNDVAEALQYRSQITGHIGGQA